MAPKTKLILASGSLGRRELLKLYGYDFQVHPADIEEPTDARLGDCRHYVAELAWLKASKVASQHDEGIILAADTVGWHRGKVVGKPENREHAFRMIAELSGQDHELWSGVCLWHRPSDRQITWQEQTLVRLKQLTPTEIEEYLDTRTWQGCSGAYAIDMHHDPYLTVVQGSLTNVIGLPMESLAQLLPIAEQLS